MSHLAKRNKKTINPISTPKKKPKISPQLPEISLTHVERSHFVNEISIHLFGILHYYFELSHNIDEISHSVIRISHSLSEISQQNILQTTRFNKYLIP